MSSPITLEMEGTLINWLKQVGEAVKAGDVIAEVEADKATVEVEAPAAGVLLEQKAQPGDSVKEGAVIGMIGESGEKAAAPAGALREAPLQTAQATSQPVVRAAEAGAPSAVIAKSNGASVLEGGRIKASPVARKIAEERGIDLTHVHGTGPNGRIVKEDVEHFTPETLTPAASPSVRGEAVSGIAPAPTRKLPEGADVEILDISTMRKRIIAVTVESNQQIPHFYVTTEMDVEALLALRKQLNDSLPEDAAKISVNDLVVKAAALTLRQFPNLNSHYYGDKLARYKRINIGIAVALGNGGLMYVVARDADKVALGTLAQSNKDMIARAREGKVKIEDITGATFSTSNLGPYDVEHFSAIINPPEAGILAVGTAMKVPVVKDDGTLGVGNRMKVTISVDHRVSDGAEGAQYLQAFKALVENPMRLLV
jgi:pyruvate dehydrogenase E2 component (dihydrolipoyllysine-residue acetyltransferase)